MSVDWGQAVNAYFADQPHPQGHGLKISEFATAVKLASMMKFGSHATPAEASMFWQEFAPGGVPMMAPQDFEHALDHIAPLSYTFHGRPPTLREIGALQDKASHEVRRYFADLPSKTHPEISAGEFVKAFQSARPWAREHLDREPVHTEAAYLHHSGERPEIYYSRLANAQNTQQQNGAKTQIGADSGGGGVPSSGGQAPRE